VSRFHSVRFYILFIALGISVTAADAQKTIHVPGDQPSVQSAINAAATGDTVLVAPGTYKEDITFLGKAITVTSSGGASQTTIDGGQSSPVVNFGNGETRSSVLNGFTITDDGPPLPTPVSGDGYAIRVYSASPTISNNIITQNRGYGIFVDMGAPLIQGNTISYTVTAGDPAGDFGCDYDDGSAINLLSSASQPAEILGNTIEYNKAQCYGGGIQSNGAAPIIENNVISNNISLGFGGAISLLNENQITIIQNVISGNNSGTAGGAIYLGLVSGADFNSGPVEVFIVNNTIVGNSITLNPDVEDAWVDGSQIAFGGYVSQTGIYNNIIEAGTSYGAIACYPVYSYLSATPPVVDHSDILNSGGPRFSGWCPDQNGTNGNISADPTFSNLAGGDFHLAVGSPAIDSGNNSAPNLLSTDFGSNVRIQNATGLPYPIIDMGAYEAPGPANLQATQISLSAQPLQLNYGATVDFQAAVTAPSGITSGTVGFFDYTTKLGQSSPNSGGAAAFSTSTLSAGMHVITAAFSGNTTLAGSVSSPSNVVVNGEPTSVGLTYSPAQPTYTQSVVLTATVQSPNGTPTGSVTFYEGDEPMASAPLNAQGIASYTFSNLAHGDWTFYALYPIQGPFATSTSQTVTVDVQPAPTTTIVTASPNPVLVNQTVTLTATVQSANLTPVGFVTFDDGSVGLGTANLNASGVATFAVSNLALGSHSITGTFVSTDGNSAQSLSAAINVNVDTVLPDFSIAVSPATLSMSAGGSGSSTLTIVPVGGYAGSISFSYSGLPGSATCGFSPSSLSPTGNNSTLTTNLTINAAATGVGTAYRANPPGWLPRGVFVAPGCLFMALIFLIALWRGCGRQWQHRVVLTFAGVLCAILLVSCGGGSSTVSSPPTPISTTYTVTVNATGTNNTGTTAHSTTLSVTITQ
jgi:parallel beta-helix repeat protein